MASHNREELEDKLIKLDMDIKDITVRIKTEETYLRVHDMDQEELDMERHLAKLKKEENEFLRPLTKDEKTEIRLKRLSIVQNIDKLNEEKKQLVEEKQGVEETLLNDYIQMVNRLIDEAPGTCIVSDLSRGVLEQHLNVLRQVLDALLLWVENKFPFHPMRYKSHNFYYLLQEEKEDMEIDGLRAVCVRHCDPPMQHKLMVCVGLISQEPNRVIMNDRAALVASDLGDFSYTGPVDNRGQRHGGPGTCIYADGSMFEGEFCKNKRQGHGVYIFPNGEKYDGEFHQDKLEQQGTWYYLSGDRYEGKFRNGSRSGYGTMYFGDGNVYEGEWVNDKPHGHGVATYSDGLKYEGEFQEGVRAGTGTISNGEGGSFEGTWKGDEKHGAGCVYFPDKVIFDGKWKNGTRHGPTTTFTAAPPPPAVEEKEDYPFQD